MIKTFNDLNIASNICELLKKQGIITPTKVQERLIPTARSGNDVIVQSKTGTGKTLAFLLPVMERIKKVQMAQALIIAPTRELAIQISKVAANLYPVTNVDSVIICGGVDFERQRDKLKRNPQLIIGTPGRLLDQLSRKAIDLSSVNKVVIDEADEMLKLGFIEDVETLIESTANDRQLILCSATIPDRIKTLAAQFMHKPQIIFVEPKVITLDNIKQTVIRIKEANKFDELCKVIDAERPYLAMIFCAKKDETSWLAEELAKKGYEVDELHGDLTQQQRNFVLKKFREAKLQLLVTTDIAARGLDIEGVTHVISFDIPRDVTSYIHRIGRTGRAGQPGTAITFVTDREMDKLRNIEAGIKKQLNVQGSNNKKSIVSNKQNKNRQENSKSRRMMKTKVSVKLKTAGKGNTHKQVNKRGYKQKSK